MPARFCEADSRSSAQLRLSLPRAPARQSPAFRAIPTLELSGQPWLKFSPPRRTSHLAALRAGSMASPSKFRRAPAVLLLFALLSPYPSFLGLHESQLRSS